MATKNNFPFYLEELSQDLNCYELKMFRVQHDETQLTAYLKKFAKKHDAEKINKIYLVRSSSTGQLAAWFGLKAATLPYNDIGDSFLIPSVELTHFAVDSPKLVSYYKKYLGFKELYNTNEKQFFEYAAPDYDEGCRFLYFPL